jgi:hypothetical protein
MENRAQRIAALKTYIKLRVHKNPKFDHYTNKERDALILECLTKIINSIGDKALPIPLEDVGADDGKS